jgi:transglutaminase/protease-like cytokinesis protein 3
MRIFLLLAVLAWGFQAAPVQNKPVRLSQVDSTVNAMRITTHDLEVLEDTLTASFATDSEKVRAIFYWMAENIAYDYDKYQASGSNPHHALPEGMDEEKFEYKLLYDVIAKRKGVCSDYAEVFKYICDFAHIPCTCIYGYGLGPLVKFSFFTGPESNHEWNAVMIHKKWYLLDVTWAATTMINNGKRTKRPRDDHYYLCPPDEFIHDHHPDDPGWQMIAAPLSPKEWVKQSRPR